MKFILLLAALALSPVGIQAQAPNAKRQFPVFDAITMTQKPDMENLGLKPITVANSNYMWAGNKVPDTTSLPDESRIAAFARLANQTSRTLAIDVEHWPLTGPPATVADTVKKLQTVIRWYKGSAPELAVGVYGVVPIEDYTNSLQGENSPRYAAWQKQNDNLAPIAQSADVLFPSVYTFYDDRNAWQKYAIAQIQEARRYPGGKPVYVFLWPQYRGVDKKLGNSFLPGDYWRIELETARKYADGIVIWCCIDKQTWNDQAPWWLETQSFLKEIGSSQH